MRSVRDRYRTYSRTASNRRSSRPEQLRHLVDLHVALQHRAGPSGSGFSGSMSRERDTTWPSRMRPAAARLVSSVIRFKVPRRFVRTPTAPVRELVEVADDFVLARMNSHRDYLSS